jgi:hypothetical protein
VLFFIFYPFQAVLFAVVLHLGSEGMDTFIGLDALVDMNGMLPPLDAQVIAMLRYVHSGIPLCALFAFILIMNFSVEQHTIHPFAYFFLLLLACEFGEEAQAVRVPGLPGRVK